MPQQNEVRLKRNPEFSITLESGGVIRGELYPRYAPQTVGNFIALANDHFYDGKAFHRCVRDFIVQAGKAEPELDYCIYGEFEFNGYKHNTLRHEYGCLSMSRGARYDTARSEFFVVLCTHERELDCLDGAYAVFGRVTDGITLLEDIMRRETDVYDAPIVRQGIRSIRVNTFGQSYPFKKLSAPLTAGKPKAAVIDGRLGNNGSMLN